RRPAAAAGVFRTHEHRGWTDDAGLAGIVCDRLRERRLQVPERITFAGFDRDRPVVQRVRARLSELGCTVADAPAPGMARNVALHAFESTEAELRAAGAWARERLTGNSAGRIGIVVSGLERDAERAARLVREGLIPGYRWAAELPAEVLNVSYGRRLSSYPAVSVALLWLRWLARDLRATDVAHLLRSPLLGLEPVAGRARLELQVRGRADRNWSPAMLTSALEGQEEAPDATDWLQRVAGLSRARRSLPATGAPAEWAVIFDEALRSAGWPGQAALDSGDFQLVNRWRDLLNDLARMDLVSPRMSLDEALLQLANMAADAVFQPESEIASVHLLGPLEASGLEFDALWLTGLSASSWPPHGNPSALISRRLQQERGMPDAVPADTVDFAARLLSHLAGAAPEIVCSYSVREDDAEQAPSELLADLGAVPAPAPPDPGWCAAAQPGSVPMEIAVDAVPPIAAEERLTGGATVIQHQLTDPIAAFAGGRLAVRALDEQAKGLPALQRGNLIHEALYRLYIDGPSRDEVAAWDDVPVRIKQAVDGAFARHERNTDRVLLELLAMERRRVAGLLQEFLALDMQREPFTVEAVERKLEYSDAGAIVELRIDRIDRLADGSIGIIDYKTGAEKKFLDGQGNPREIQLVVYACAADAPVGSLALANVDSRIVGFHGVGADFGRQSVEDARALNLLSRFTELRNER
ncbi:MAG: PD-(D/E)XK nuclease family protein, partial [Woeseiaceae bacterium]